MELSVPLLFRLRSSGPHVERRFPISSRSSVILRSRAMWICRLLRKRHLPGSPAPASRMILSELLWISLPIAWLRIMGLLRSRMRSVSSTLRSTARFMRLPLCRSDARGNKSNIPRDTVRFGLIFYICGIRRITWRCKINRWPVTLHAGVTGLF